MTRRRIHFLILGGLFCAWCLWAGSVYFFSTELAAKRAVDAHLHSLKTGHGNPYDTVDIVRVQEIYVNVLEYKYLSTVNVQKVEEKLIFDRMIYESAYNKLYPSFEAFLDGQQRLYGERAIRDEDKVIVLRDSYHYNYSLLYDLEVTNRLGQKLYKKVIFDLEPDILKTKWPFVAYRITRFYER